MRLPRARFTVRALMVAVAVAGVALAVGAHRLKQRRHRLLAAAYLKLASKYDVSAYNAGLRREYARDAASRGESRAAALRGWVRARSGPDRLVPGLGSLPAGVEAAAEQVERSAAESRGEAAAAHRAARHFAALQRKYFDAGLAPWLPVEPDPPEPK